MEVAIDGISATVNSDMSATISISDENALKNKLIEMGVSEDSVSGVIQAVKDASSATVSKDEIDKNITVAN